ncbi:ATP-binding domain-containing protein [Lysobacter gummosus]|uniref:ATP-binding domain-containing protein n=2 Tax=Lysobacter gummosus TaxID=262324 RepID=A0ABY3XBU0_9GAMM|nr:ATP-binding domain-containing protein [Lysobacter gummosus]UNP30073.1 ATP-binding domain-containing protein [Lysobacter gummosus]
MLVIGDSMNVQGRHQLASQTPGAIAVEAVDLRDLVNFARRFDLQASDALQNLAEFASSMMTGVGSSNLATRVGSLRSGRARTPPTPIEWCAVTFDTERTMHRALQLVNALTDHAGTRVYRPEILYCCRSAMQAVINGGQDFLSAALRARERNRHVGHPLPRRSVGSTLLLKGLEADIAVVLQPETMTAQNLYVAFTRGAKGLVVCSQTPVLSAAR